LDDPEKSSSMMLPKILTKEQLSAGHILSWIVGHPIPLIAVIAVISLIFALQIPTLSFKTSIYDLVAENIPETNRYQQLKHTLQQAAGNLHREEFCLFSDSLANPAASCGECAHFRGSRNCSDLMK
jgi:hypothetical protein